MCIIMIETYIRKKVGHRYTKRDSRGTDACALRRLLLAHYLRQLTPNFG